MTLATAALLLAGCMNWGTRPPSPAAFKDGPTLLGVVREAGDTLVLRDPGIEGDSVVGWAVTGGTPVRHAVAMTDISALITSRSNYAAAILGGMALSFLAISTLLALALSSGT